MDADEGQEDGARGEVFGAHLGGQNAGFPVVPLQIANQRRRLADVTQT
jgi:hypothetical protein